MGGQRGCTPGGVPPDPSGGEVGLGPLDPRSGDPNLPTDGLGGGCQCGECLRPTVFRRRMQWPGSGRYGDRGSLREGGKVRAPRIVEGAGAGLPRLESFQNARPSHDRFRGVRIGEASNFGPVTLPPWQPDSDHTANFAIFGEGWVVFVFAGPIVSCGTMYSFPSRAPWEAGQRPSSSRGRATSFWSLEEGQAYVCAEARPVLPRWEGAHEFHLGHPGFGAAVVKIRMAPSGLVWRTGDPRDAERPWTHADVACGIGGFTIRSCPVPRCLHHPGLRHQPGGDPSV